MTARASGLIFPHETASSGRAPESLPSNSLAVLRNTEKSAPFRCGAVRGQVRSAPSALRSGPPVRWRLRQSRLRLATGRRFSPITS